MAAATQSAGEHAHREQRDHNGTQHEGHVEDDVVGDEDASPHVVVDRSLQNGVDGDLEHLCTAAEQHPADEVGTEAETQKRDERAASGHGERDRRGSTWTPAPDERRRD